MTLTTQRAVALGLCSVWCTLLLAGCAPLEQQVSEHPGTAIGATAGAVGGAVLGGLLFKSTTGAVVGGLVGALAGGLIGNATEAKKQNEEATNQEYGYKARQGIVIRIEEVEVEPAQIRPGGRVNLSVQYALMTPQANQEVTITERWAITHNGQEVGEPVHTVQHPGGTWAGSLPLTLPRSAEPGTYRVVAIVEAENKADRRETTFVVRR